MKTKVFVYFLGDTTVSIFSLARWLKRNMRPTEDLQSVIQKLSNFGPIRSVRLCGLHSAIVVFENTTSACNAMSAFHSRTPGTMVQCSWQQPFMSKVVRVPLPKTDVSSFSFLLPKCLLWNGLKGKQSLHPNEMYDTNLDFWTHCGLCAEMPNSNYEGYNWILLPCKSKI